MTLHGVDGMRFFVMTSGLRSRRRPRAALFRGLRGRPRAPGGGAPALPRERQPRLRQAAPRSRAALRAADAPRPQAPLFVVRFAPPVLGRRRLSPRPRDPPD